MSLRKIFKAKAAAAALAVGMLTAAPAFAQDQPETDTTAAATITTPVEDGTAAETEKRMHVSISNPHMPYMVIGGLGGLALLLSLYGASRGMRGSWLRAGAAGAFSVAMLNPQLMVEEHEPLPAEVAVIVDQSASQGLNGRGETTEAMREAILKQLEALEGVNVRVIEAGKGADQEAQNGTNLFTTMTQGIADIPAGQLGGVIVLTDGQIHDAARVPKGDAPLHALISGNDTEVDRRIVLESAPSFGVVNETVTITLRVEEDGVQPGTSGAVEIVASIDGDPVQTQSVIPGETVEMTLRVPHRGENIIALEVSALEGEITTLNNRVVAPLEGIRDNLRVLLVSGAPNAGERAWRNLLKSDPAIELAHFTILRPPNKQDMTPVNESALIGFPSHELFMEKINDFDLVIFDRWYRQGILPDAYLESVNEYVRDGGAILIVNSLPDATSRGLYSTPLGRILPAVPTGGLSDQPYSPEVSETGERHPVTRNLEGSGDTDWGEWVRRIDVSEVTGDVLMQTDDDRPLLILKHEEDGRVALLLSDSAWLWARGHDGGGPYQELMRRVSHWLMQEPALEEEALRMRQDDDGRLVIERQTLADETAPVILYSPSGEQISVTLEQAGPGLWRTAVDTDEIGLYTAQQGDKETFINVGPANPLEFRDTRSTMDVMQQPVADSGGRIGRMADGDRLDVPQIRIQRDGQPMSGGDWIGIKESEASILKGTEKTSLFAGFAGLGALALLLSLMWAREGDSPLLRKETYTRNRKSGGAVPPQNKPPGSDGPSI